MDNIASAVMASVVFASGFIHGLLVYMFMNSIHVADVERKLQDAIDKKFQMDLEIDHLKERINDLEEINSKARDVLDGKVYLPPPPWKLRRIDESEYSDSDSEDETPVVTSP